MNPTVGKRLIALGLPTLPPSMAWLMTLGVGALALNAEASWHHLGRCGGAAIAALAVPAQAATVFNGSIPIADTTLLPCLNSGAGEVVDIQGTTHVVVIDEVVGSMMTARFFFNSQGVSGVGQPTARVTWWSAREVPS